MAENPAKFYESKLYNDLPLELDIVIHCAAPYQTVPVMQATHQELLDCAFVNGMELLILATVSQRIKSGGTLLVAGSVSGERYCNSITRCNIMHPITNEKYCSLHAIHKGAVRDLMYCLHIEQPDKRIIYTSISGFMEKVADQERNTYLTTSEVAHQLVALALDSKKPETFSIQILSQNVAKKMRKKIQCSRTMYKEND